MYLSITAAEVAVQSSPPDYLPAVIGLLGVFLGGMIQTFAQISKDRSARVTQTRTDVLKFAHAAFSFVDVTNQYAGLYVGMEVESQKVALQRMNDLMHEAHERGLALAGSSDVRVGTFAVDVINKMMAYKDSFAHIFEWKGKRPAPDKAADYPTRDEVREEINVLINMVHPRVFERHLRFRSEETTRKALAKEARKDASRRR